MRVSRRGTPERETRFVRGSTPASSCARRRIGRSFDAIGELADPSYEWHTSREMPEATVYRGLDAVKAFGYEFVDQWEEYRVEIERLFESGDSVLLLWRVRAKGKGSGVAVDRFMAYLNTLQSGKLVRTQVFLDRQAALEAARLSEQDPFR